MLCEAQARGVTTPEESGIEVSEEAILVVQPYQSALDSCPSCPLTMIA